MAEPLPLILDDASLKISTDDTVANLKELACVTNHIELSPDVSTTTIDTMCGSRDFPGQVKWSLVATLYQSFDPDATEEVLSAAVANDGPVAFEIVPYKSKPVGPTNPAWSGLVIPQPYAPINGDAGDASTVELEWALTGEPVKSTTPDTLAATETATETGTDYNSMTVAQLQAEAEGRGLATTGTKAELVQRLTDADAAAASV
jgi:hypothetical protein